MSAERNEKLLIVEDEAVAREGLAVILGKEGYKVALAASGQEALDYLDAHPPPDLILLDMFMPALDGWGFLKQLHGRPAASVPLIVMTAIGLSREWALHHGCAGFVSKPIDLGELLAEIRRCLPATD